ncbi:MAG: lipoprotein signal peptidase [Gammaproteobacteria bacterium]|jgi:signal peptidase II|nr:lipoprotein signal peptidase [Gammaproteobacteria bacterium]MBT7523267.1 lipoprotein signal peptidase [Gammaproteobacteria bacterium]MBT7814481.1 lipoprotein signal peptidase [Gammaproteobacteria bacterium]
MPKKNLIIFSIISIVFFLDFVTKNYAITNLLLNHSEAINTYLNFTLAFNYGAAFSFLSDAGGWQRWFFVIFSIIVVFFISYILIKDKESEYISYSLVLGGALGNLYDRIFLGYVIDFIEFHYNDFYWPIFNIADIAISIGVILLLYSMFLKDNKKI